MNVDRLRGLRLASPFQPFYLIVKDGRRFFVDEPHHLGLAPDGSRLGVVTKGETIFLGPDDVKDVDVLPTPLKRRQA